MVGCEPITEDATPSPQDPAISVEKPESHSKDTDLQETEQRVLWGGWLAPPRWAGMPFYVPLGHLY